MCCGILGLVATTSKVGSRFSFCGIFLFNHHMTIDGVVLQKYCMVSQWLSHFVWGIHSNDILDLF
jgi:hypothetical protein